MFQGLLDVLSGGGYMPHGHCYLWQPYLLWTFVVSDSLIAFSYYSIPLALLYFVRKRRDLQFNWIFLMFSLFIFACGTTHLVDLWTIWNPDYWIEASFKLFTAAASVTTSVMLWRLIPQALQIPSRQELEDTVTQLEREVVSRRQTESALFAEKQRAVVTLESIGDGVITTDTRACVVYLNPIAEQMTGWSTEEARGRPLAEIFRTVNEQTREVVQTPVDAVLDLGVIQGMCNHILLIGRRGDEYAIQNSAAPIRDSDGTLFGVVLVFHDMSEHRRLSRRMAYLAEHDYLTGLPNRILFKDRLMQALNLARRDQEYVALMFLDLDRFKNINDTLGHEVGDRLLKMVAKRLGACLRDSDTLSRQGGDEFMIMLPKVEDRFAPADVAEKLLEAAAAPYLVGSNEIVVTVSIGIAVFPEDGDSSETLTKSADAAMYHAKSLGRNNYQFFTQSMNDRVSQLTELEQDLRRALEHCEFALYFQPKFDLGSGSLVGAEVLLRWLHPEWGLVLPHRFIPVAEDCGLIRQIGNWVIAEACRHHQLWEAQGLAPVPLAVNLSTVQLRHRDFLEDTTRILTESGMAPGSLEFEVTESVAIEGEGEAIRWLGVLKEMGMGLSVDDFGTGYSSLAYLKRLPVDSLKIDKSFIRDISTDAEDAAIITAIIRMSHGLSLKVIAEGVETPEQLEFLRGEGCDQFQGFLASPPLSAEAFARFLEARQDGKSAAVQASAQK